MPASEESAFATKPRMCGFIDSNGSRTCESDAVRACAVACRADASRMAKQGKGTKQGGPGAGAGGARGAPSAAEVARRREQMAAAAEARQKALQAAAGQQRLWSVRPQCPAHAD